MINEKSAGGSKRKVQWSKKVIILRPTKEAPDVFSSWMFFFRCKVNAYFKYLMLLFYVIKQYVQDGNLWELLDIRTLHSLKDVRRGVSFVFHITICLISALLINIYQLLSYILFLSKSFSLFLYSPSLWYPITKYNKV